MKKFDCPECGTDRIDHERVCPACGAPPVSEQREESIVGGVRTTDLEPYLPLRYIARLFKVLAVLMILMLIGEVAVGLITVGRGAIVTLLAEATRLLVMAGLLWAAGDFAILMIDAGHDIRVSRILLGRINAQLHKNPGDVKQEGKSPEAYVDRAPRP